MQEKNSSFKKKLKEFKNSFQGMDCESIKSSFINHLEYSLAKDEYTATEQDCYASLAYLTRDRLIERWIETQQAYYDSDAKWVYYLSMEFLIGRTLGNSLINLGILKDAECALNQLGRNMEELQEKEWDAGLGNGGLGRLAACFMDSLSTLEYPAAGYGIRYEFGMFFQSIINGYQVETPDNWLRLGNIWEFPRPEYMYRVNFYGRVNQYTGAGGKLRTEWTDTEEVMAMAYDIPVPGYRNNTVNNLRLWSAKSSRGFNLEYFNHGDYERAVLDSAMTENISRVLYPNDNVFVGKELRMKQQYFFVSATLQDIIRRYRKFHDSFHAFPEKVVIQLNDTHPSIAIPELMRIFIDEEDMGWDEAWDITSRCFGYTNHTVLPEALERWPVSLMERVLPRHMQIIYEINRRFLDEIEKKFPGNKELPGKLSIIEEGPEKKVRMANLSIISSFSVNGVAALHTDILKKFLFRDFYTVFPEKFNNKTNGITQRRWLKLCNPELADLISSRIGDKWITDLTKLKELIPLADDKDFREEWAAIKQRNKEKLSGYILSHNGIDVNRESMFDIQVKRIHEYKRQLLNVFHAVTLYNRMKENPEGDYVPRTIIFAGKAAPGYTLAKLIIKLITSVGEAVNSDPETADRLRVIFLRNYAVSNAEKIIPAADLSEQISTAGFEASGTGNMKFSLNGALTIGTLDGANVEMLEEIGRENFFLFGMDAAGVVKLRRSGYNPHSYYTWNGELRRVIDMINNGYFSPDNPGLFRPLIDSLLYRGDMFMLLADYKAYISCQEEVSRTFREKEKWTRMSIINTASMGKFSSDRTIREYAEDIWGIKPVPVEVSSG